MSIWQYVAASFTVAAGAGLQGTLGFGLGLLAAPLLALIHQELIPTPLLIPAILLSAMTAIREFGDADFSGLSWALVGRLPGTALGAAAVAWLPVRGLDATFGLLILLAVAMSITGWSPVPSRPALLGAGAMSGLMGTAVATGAAPLAIMYQGSGASSLRATLSAFFCIGSTISLITLALFGEVGAEQLRDGALLVPPVLAGWLFSGPIIRRLDDDRTRLAVLTVASLASIGLLLRAVLYR